jgi:hypothetical protein
LCAIDRRIQRAVVGIVLLRLAERVDRVLVVALRLQRRAEAAIRLGVGELELGPRLAQLGRAPPVARAQHARSFGAHDGDLRPAIGEARRELGVDRQRGIVDRSSRR